MNSATSHREETDDIVQAGVEVDVGSGRIVKTIRTHKGKRKVVSSVSSGPDAIDEFLFHDSSPPPAPSETSSFVARKGHGTIISVDLPPIPPIPGGMQRKSRTEYLGAHQLCSIAL